EQRMYFHSLEHIRLVGMNAQDTGRPAKGAIALGEQDRWKGRQWPKAARPPRPEDGSDGNRQQSQDQAAQAFHAFTCSPYQLSEPLKPCSVSCLQQMITHIKTGGTGDDTLDNFMPIPSS